MNKEALSNGRRIVELGNEIEKLPGFKHYYQNLKGLDISLHIFTRNYTDLKNIITFITTDPRGAIFYTVENRYKLEEFGYDVICRIHNYVAAAKSLVDHTHNLTGKLYKINNLFPEYQEKIDDDFKYDPLSKFVQDLRRYCQHFKSPIVMFRTTFDSNGSPLRNVSIPLDE